VANLVRAEGATELVYQHRVWCRRTSPITRDLDLVPTDDLDANNESSSAFAGLAPWASSD
jgi:hypothetical protein